MLPFVLTGLPSRARMAAVSNHPNRLRPEDHSKLLNYTRKMGRYGATIPLGRGEEHMESKFNVTRRDIHFLNSRLHRIHQFGGAVEGDVLQLIVCPPLNLAGGQNIENRRREVWLEVFDRYNSRDRLLAEQRRGA